VVSLQFLAVSRPNEVLTTHSLDAKQIVTLCCKAALTPIRLQYGLGQHQIDWYPLWGFDYGVVLQGTSLDFFNEI